MLQKKNGVSERMTWKTKEIVQKRWETDNRRKKIFPCILQNYDIQPCSTTGIITRIRIKLKEINERLNFRQTQATSDTFGGDLIKKWNCIDGENYDLNFGSDLQKTYLKTLLLRKQNTPKNKLSNRKPFKIL